MIRTLHRSSTLLTLALLAARSLGAAEPAKLSYSRDVQPILAANCFLCHGPDAGNRKAGLRLDSAADATKALKSGDRAIVPGHPEKSALVERINADDSERMPPLKKSPKGLTAVEKATLTRWIAEGAVYEKHWSFVPPKSPPLPAGSATNPIDRFVRADLVKGGMSPAPEADRYTLARRVAIDLTGLPPTVAEVDAFVADKTAGAYERFVDKMLASPAYGERWAAMWLDLARYADSNGYAEDQPRTIWKYRDWVIDAFNRNLSYDRFTIEQIAGDMLPNPTTDQLLATAFHRNTLTNTEGGTDDEEFRNIAVVDRVNTTMQVWMAVTVNCAQCHDHKYDPITQEEYYRLFAIFNQSEDSDKSDNRPNLPYLSDEDAAK
jgi:cytochrome c553